MPDGAFLGDEPCANVFTAAMPAGSFAELTAASGTWAAAADVHFNLVADGGGAFDAAGPAGLNGNIRVGGCAALAPGVLAHGYYPPPNGVSASGDVHFNTAFAWVTAGPAPGPPFDVQTVALHELGHALGLEHVPGDPWVPADIMFPMYTGVKRALSAQDIFFMTAIYGPGGHPAECAGACCFGQRICGMRSQTDCAAQGGNFRGPGTQCPTQNGMTVQHANGPVFHSVDPAFDCNTIRRAPGERGQSDCCSSHESPGCDNHSCQQQVCEMAPDCCFNAWLPHCADLAHQFCGALCESTGECQPGVTVDAWATSSEPSEPTCNRFGQGSPPIPSGFFSPGSQPFFGQVCYAGEPLGATPFGDFNVADTLVRRPAGDPFGSRCAIPGYEIDIPIEIVALNLVSLQPITVQYPPPRPPEQWNVRLGLSDFMPQQPQGLMTVRKTHCNGGTWTSFLPVRAKFTFTQVGNPANVHVLDTGDPQWGFPVDVLQVMAAENAPWVSDLDPNLQLEGCPTNFHPGIQDPDQNTSCDCNSNGQRDSCDLEQGLSQDCNGNTTPDECDISAGASPDCNANGTPDECETCQDSTGSLCRSPSIMSAVSRKANASGPGGVCDLPTGFNGSPASSEPRNGGIEMLVVRFDDALVSGSPSSTDVTVDQQVCTLACNGCSATTYAPSGIAPTTVSACANELTLTFSPGLPNARKYRVGMGSNITTAANQYVEIRGLIGDATGNGRVDAGDRSAVVGAWTAPGSFSCPSDITNNGQTNAADRSAVVGAWTSPLASCAP
jgi:hypothetical protein